MRKVYMDLLALGLGVIIIMAFFFFIIMPNANAADRCGKSGPILMEEPAASPGAPPRPA